MHGIILSELQRYGRGKLGVTGWQKLLAEAGLSGRNYMVNAAYPDREIAALVSGAVRVTGLPRATLLEDFGRFIAPTLMMVYKSLLDPGWKTLDLIEHTEESIHTVLRARDDAAEPPHLSVRRDGPRVAVLTYRSHRRLCAVAKGIAHGVAAHYGERLSITEEACMAGGAPACTLRLQVG
jgi:hypothetical protein